MLNKRKFKKLSHDSIHYVEEAYKNSQKGLIQHLKKHEPFFEKNLHHVDKLVEIDIPIPAYYSMIHSIFQSMDYRTGADKAIKKAISLKPKAKYYHQHGMSLKSRKQWWQAVDAFSKSIELHPKGNIVTYREYAYALEAMSRLDEAIKAWETAESIKPLTTYQYYRYGYVLEKSGQQQRAEDNYKKAIKLDKDYNSQELGIGIFHEKKGLWGAASNAYKRTAKQQPKNAAIHYKLGLSYDRCYNWKKAETSFLDAIAICTDEAQYFYRLGFVYERQKQWNKAENSYQQAIERKEDFTPVWFYRLGYVLTQQGKHEEANTAFLEQRVLQEAHGVAEAQYNKDNKLKIVVNYTEYYERYELDTETILYESYHGNSISGNPYALFKSLYQDDRFITYKHIWVINDKAKIPESLKGTLNIIFITRNCDLYMRYLCKAKYLINNVTFPDYFIRQEQQIYLNTWHGTPIKTLGKDVEDDFMAHKNQIKNFLQTSHIITPNHHTTSVLSESYDIAEIYTGIMATTGYPRQDLMLNISSEEKENIYTHLNISNKKPIVLYAPTWRGTVGESIFDTSQLERDIHSIQEIENIHILFRGHYMVENILSTNNPNITVVPPHIDTNSLLSIVDILITDYSSISIDFMALNRPIIYYVYDREEYEKERGLYFTLEDLGGDICYDNQELKASVVKNLYSKNISEAQKKAQQRFCPYDDGKASQRVIDLIFFENKSNLDTLKRSNKESILIYGGPLMANGITTSLINLVNHIDQNKYSVTVVIDPSAIASNPSRVEQFNKFNKNIQILPRVGRMTMTLEEKWVLSKFKTQKHLDNQELWDYYQQSHQREFKRVFGYGKYNYVINFEGYTEFWATLMGMKNSTIQSNSIYQHNDMYGEWKLKHSYLEGTFNLYHFYNRYVSVSKSTKNHNLDNLSNQFSLPEKNFTYCDNVQNPEGVLRQALEKIESKNHSDIFKNSIVFINIARLSPEKGHKKLLKAFKKISIKHQNAKLINLGDGVLKNNINELIKELNLEKKVFFLGQQSNPYPYLKKSDCFILSSEHEGQPMTLLEAMILEKPIIATDIVGNRSVLEGRPGLLIENSENGLYQGMLTFLEGGYREDVIFDYKNYNQSALTMFYKKITSIEVEKQ